MIQAERSRAAALKVLGKVSGVLGSDRYAVYDFWPSGCRQSCWAHLSRLFVKFSERHNKDVQEIGLALIGEKDQMFEWWHRVRDGTLSRGTFPVPYGPAEATRHRIARARSPVFLREDSGRAPASAS